MDHPRNIDQMTRQRGFSLIEVFFAIFIIVFVLFALNKMTVLVMRSNSLNDHTSSAIDLAQDKMEELKSAFLTSTNLVDLQAANNNDLSSTTNYDFQESNIDGLGRSGGIYTRTWNVADNSPKAGMKSVAVIVTWMDQMGDHRVMLRTIL